MKSRDDEGKGCLQMMVCSAAVTIVLAYLGFIP